jgi:hypothetical protein
MIKLGLGFDGDEEVPEQGEDEMPELEDDIVEDDSSRMEEVD